MASQTTPITSYKDTGSTGTIKRQVSDKFLLMSPSKFPELSIFGGGSDDTPTLNTLDLSEGEMKADRIEWFEDSLRPITWGLSADILSGATAFVTTVAADAAYLLEDMVILMESEQMLVTANGNGGTGSVSITRGYNGTTAAAHTAATVGASGVKLVTRAHEEGTDAPSDPWISPDNFYNFWQTFMEEIKISDAERAMDRYINDPGGYLERQRAKKYKEIFKQLTLSFYRGNRVASASGAKSQTGGIEVFLNPTLVQDKSAAALTTTHVNTLMQNIFDFAGADQVANTVICSSANKVKLSALFSSTVVTVYRDQQVRVGGVLVDEIATEFGMLDIVMSNWCPTDRIYFLNRDLLHIGPLRNNDLHEKPLATSGDYEREVVTGIYAWQIMGSKCHGIIKNFT